MALQVKVFANKLTILNSIPGAHLEGETMISARISWHIRHVTHTSINRNKLNPFGGARCGSEIGHFPSTCASLGLEMADEHALLLQRTKYQAPTRQLTIACNSGSRGSFAHFWPLQAPGMCTVHIHTGKTLMHKSLRFYLQEHPTDRSHCPMFCFLNSLFIS